MALFAIAIYNAQIQQNTVIITPAPDDELEALRLALIEHCKDENGNLNPQSLFWVQGLGNSVQEIKDNAPLSARHISNIVKLSS